MSGIFNHFNHDLFQDFAKSAHVHLNRPKSLGGFNRPIRDTVSFSAIKRAPTSITGKGIGRFLSKLTRPAKIDKKKAPTLKIDKPNPQENPLSKAPESSRADKKPDNATLCTNMDFSAVFHPDKGKNGWHDFTQPNPEPRVNAAPSYSPLRPLPEEPLLVEAQGDQIREDMKSRMLQSSKFVNKIKENNKTIKRLKEEGGTDKEWPYIQMHEKANDGKLNTFYTQKFNHFDDLSRENFRQEYRGHPDLEDDEFEMTKFNFTGTYINAARFNKRYDDLKKLNPDELSQKEKLELENLDAAAGKIGAVLNRGRQIKKIKAKSPEEVKPEEKIYFKNHARIAEPILKSHEIDAHYMVKGKSYIDFDEKIPLNNIHIPWGGDMYNPYQLIVLDWKKDNALRENVESIQNKIEADPDKSFHHQYWLIANHVNQTFPIKVEQANLYLFDSGLSNGNRHLLGSYIQSGIGVCFHKALLTKIICDKLGLRSTLESGTQGDEEAAVEHAWNRVKIGDKISLLDTLQEKWNPWGENSDQEYFPGEFFSRGPRDTEHTNLHLAGEIGEIEGVKELLESSEIYINTRNDDGRTPLWVAANAGHEGVVDKLLQSGAYLNLPDNDRKTALMAAIANRHNGVVQKLLDAGARLDSQDSLDRTAKDFAAKLPDETISKMLDFEAQMKSAGVPPNSV